MEIYIITYIACCLIVLGFQLEKSDSIFIEVDFMWIVTSAIIVILSPLTLPVILGAKIHG